MKKTSKVISLLIISIGAIAFAVYQLFFQTYNIGAASMAPTLIQGDSILALKANGNGRYQRGDLILFLHTNPAEEIYVKRIVGLPGDRIKFDRQTISINGTQLKHTQQSDNWADAATPRWLQGSTYLEQNHDAQYELLIIDKDSGPKGSVTVPENHYFVMGDNRSQSRDSRFIGPVPASTIIGKPLIIWWSQVTLPRNVIRWKRIGRSL